MRILIISDAWYPQVNGVVRTYEHFRDELIAQNHDVKIIGPADFKCSIPMPGYSEIRLALFAYGALKKQIDAYKPDTIHIATEGPLGLAALRYCRERSLNFSTSYHTQFPDYFAKRVTKYMPCAYQMAHTMAKNFVRNFHAGSSAMMVATQSLEDELRAWGFKTPMFRVTRGVKLDQFYPGQKTLFKTLDQPVALYVGRVAVEKNIEAFLSMDWSGSKVVVGDGPSLEALKRRFPSAQFVGKKQGAELAEYYRSADIFVFPSKTDTFGIVLIEALASGLPVVGYDVTGPKDIITEDFLGALSHDDDLSVAAQEALKQAGDTQARKRAQYVKDYYNWTQATQQFLDAIHSFE